VPGLGCAAGHCHRGCAHLSPSTPQGPARIRAGIHPLVSTHPSQKHPDPEEQQSLSKTSSSVRYRANYRLPYSLCI
jgi:hypothetical protein